NLRPEDGHLLDTLEERLAEERPVHADHVSPSRRPHPVASLTSRLRQWFRLHGERVDRLYLARAKVGAARPETLVVRGIEDLLERGEAVDRDPDAIALRPGRAIGVPLVQPERDAVGAQGLSEEQSSEPRPRDEDWLCGAHDWRVGRGSDMNVMRTVHNILRR